jgi:hypothetical protein
MSRPQAISPKDLRIYCAGKPAFSSFNVVDVPGTRRSCCTPNPRAGSWTGGWKIVITVFQRFCSIVFCECCHAGLKSRWGSTCSQRGRHEIGVVPMESASAGRFQWDSARRGDTKSPQSPFPPIWIWLYSATSLIRVLD